MCEEQKEAIVVGAQRGKGVLPEEEERLDRPFRSLEKDQ